MKQLRSSSTTADTSCICTCMRVLAIGKQKAQSDVGGRGVTKPVTEQ